MNQWVFSNRLWKKHMEIYIHLNINVVNISWKFDISICYAFFSCLPIGSITLLTSGCFLPALCLSRYVSPSCFPCVAFLCASSVMVPWQRSSPQRLVALQFTGAPRGGSAASRNLRDLSWDTLIALGCPGKPGRHQSLGGGASPGQPQRYRFDEDSTQTPRGRHNVEGHSVETPFSNV